MPRYLDLGVAQTRRDAGRGGTGGPTLLLLHGMGATLEVWSGLIHRLGAGSEYSWRAADLPGHGGSPPLGEYTYAIEPTPRGGRRTAPAAVGPAGARSP